MTDAPLCPALYQILVRRFGRVTIHSPREPFIGIPSRDVAGRIQMRVRTAGEYYAVSCPFCRDRKRRLWINHTYGQIEPDGRPRTWAAICYNEGCLSDPGNRQRLYDLTLGFQNQRTRHLPLVIEAVPADDGLFRAEPPGDVVPVAQLPESHPAREYLRSRPSGVYTPEFCEAYGLGYVRNAPRHPVLENRLYIPVVMHGQLVGWQGRILDRDAPGPKYSSMPRMKRRLLLYNFDRAKFSPWVIVMEGPTDTHVLAECAVGVLGKGISAPQISLLCMTWSRKPIIVMFDGDAADATYHAALQIAECRGGAGGGPVIPVYLPGDSDPGDFTPDALWGIVREQARPYLGDLPARHGPASTESPGATRRVRRRLLDL